MTTAESYINERLDHLGIVAGVCQEIGFAARGVVLRLIRNCLELRRKMERLPLNPRLEHYETAHEYLV